MQSRIHTLLFAFVCASCDLLSSTPKTKENPDHAPKPKPAVTSKDATAPMTEKAKMWVAFMRGTMPAMMCEQSYTKACFDLAPGDCETEAKSYFDACVEKHRDEIPSEPNETNGEVAGRILGECTGEDFENGLKAKGRMVSSKECDAERAKVLGAAK
jgi:hypothetical protein